jgi:hypothetical protein
MINAESLFWALWPKNMPDLPEARLTKKKSGYEYDFHN